MKKLIEQKDKLEFSKFGRSSLDILYTFYDSESLQLNQRHVCQATTSAQWISTVSPDAPSRKRHCWRKAPRLIPSNQCEHREQAPGQNDRTLGGATRVTE